MSYADRVVMMHAGGWDEILIGLGPLVVIGALIYIARKGVPLEEEEEQETVGEPGAADEPTGPREER